MDERQLADAIDRAVSEMMNVDADATFRSRVLARIGGPPPRFFTWRRMAVAAAAAVAVVLAFVLTRTAPPEPAAIDVARNRPAPLAVDVPASPQVDPGPGHDRDDKVRGRVHRTLGRRERIREPVTHATERDSIVAAVAPPESAVDVPPLEPIEPVSVVPLDTSPIVTAEIIIQPLTPITRVQIAPLSPLAERSSGES